MRILCVSDTDESIVYSPGGREYVGKPDLALSCGDLPLECYDYISTVYNCDVCYVYGNHNLQHFDKALNKHDMLSGKNELGDYMPNFFGYMIDGKSIYLKKKDIIIAGLGGCMLYNGGKSQYSEKQMKRRIEKLIPSLIKNKILYGRYVDILVTHSAPFGIGDGPDLCHTGFKCFKTFIERFEPKYLLHGHIHLDNPNDKRVYTYMNTNIINVYNHYILEYDKKKGEVSIRI